MILRLAQLGLFSLLAVCLPQSAEARTEATAIAGLTPSGDPQTVEAALHQMSDRASVVFVGSVVSIHKLQADGAGVVEIQFSVEQAIRGCSGATYSLREWGGLWIANDSRYRVGQRLLLLLHAPSSTGLSSPVGGMDGAIPLRASGSGIHSADSSSATAETVADLRWIGARLTRTVIYMPSTAVQTAARTAALPQASPAQQPQTSPSISDASKPAQEASVSTIVGMLRSWEVTNAAR